MSTKLENLQDANSCLGKAADNEPIFILRANDPLAPIVVEIWANLGLSLDAHEAFKCLHACDVANEMRAWYEKKYGEPFHNWNK